MCKKNYEIFIKKKLFFFSLRKYEPDGNYDEPQTIL